MTDAIIPRPGILDIAPYQGGKATLGGRADAVKLSSNENPAGPPPGAVAAVASVLPTLHRYPSSDHAALRAAIAAAFDLDADRIICGAGSDEIIAFLCQAYAGPGDEVLHTEHGFLMYRLSALAAGATPVAVPERARTADVDALLAACTDRTRLVFIANPNNPTGTMIDADEVARLAAGLPPRALLVLDGAYAEYVEGHDGGAGLVAARENVVMTRTFSKIYGLGGLRVGWAFAPAHVIDVLNRVRGPFNLSSVQLAAAEAAVRDADYPRRSRVENARLRDWLGTELARHGVPSDPSFANFVLARFADPGEAQAADAFLQSRGLIARQVGSYGLPECLRISVGDAAACERVAAAIADFRTAAA